MADSAGAHHGTREEVAVTTSFGISGAGLTGTLRLTWVSDDLAHVLSHAGQDEAPGTWTGLACPGHRLLVGGDVDTATLRDLCAGGDIADLVWEVPDELAAEHDLAFSAAMRAYQDGDTPEATRLWDEVQESWSRSRAANITALEFMQHAGLDRFAAVKPQRWVIASFGHHASPHGIQHPHVHNIVVTALTTRGWASSGNSATRAVKLRCSMRQGRCTGSAATSRGPGNATSRPWTWPARSPVLGTRSTPWPAWAVAPSPPVSSRRRRPC